MTNGSRLQLMVLSLLTLFYRLSENPSPDHSCEIIDICAVQLRHISTKGEGVEGRNL